MGIPVIDKFFKQPDVQNIMALMEKTKEEAKIVEERLSNEIVKLTEERDALGAQMIHHWDAISQCQNIIKGLEGIPQ